MDFTFNEEMKSIKDSFQNDVNDVELEDDILTKRSKSDERKYPWSGSSFRGEVKRQSLRV